MATQAMQEQDDKEFDAAFSEPDQTKKVVSEDEAFGIEADAPVVTDAVAEDAPHGEMPAAEGEAAPVTESEAPVEPESEAAKNEQQLKSWEGRLKAREAELSAREAAMTTTNAEETQTVSDPVDGEAKTEAQAEGGIDPEAVIRGDFGDEFADAFIALIKKHSGGGGADEAVGNLQSRVDGLISELTSERQENHFASIRAQHEDFESLTDTPEFQAWIDANPDKENAERVVASGSAKEIIALLNDFKASKQVTESPQTDPASEPDAWGDTETAQEEDPALDDAEGVRSSGGGLKLPAAPEDSSDFDEAWDKA